MAIAEPTINDITKYYVTDSELRLLADAIREEGGTTASLNYPYGFAKAISNLRHVKDNTLIVRSFPPQSFNKIYSTTEEELSLIASNIRYRTQNTGPLIFIEDFINNLINVQIAPDSLEVVSNTQNTFTLQLYDNTSNTWSSYGTWTTNYIFYKESFIQPGQRIILQATNERIQSFEVKEGNITINHVSMDIAEFTLNDDHGGVIYFDLEE